MEDDNLKFIKRINPKVNLKYNARIYRFLLKHRQFKFSVFVGPDNQRFFGNRWHEPSNDTIGRSLFSILHGKTSLGVFIGTENWTEEKDFWDKYVEIGMCILDPDHTKCYDGRFELNSEFLRTCNWCGIQHTLKSWKEVVEHSYWEALQKGS